MKSYRDLPRTLYHIQWKFRDEVRPRFGVMRGREFLMKDAYSFDLDEAGARQSYYTQMLAYLRTFQRMGIQAVPMKAASGPIGGDLSHEFIVLAPTGESEVFYDAAYEEFDWQQSDLRYGDEAGLQALFDRVNSTYAATDETHDVAKWEVVPEDKRRTGRGIEVGHIFYFGDKYSAAMGLKVSGPRRHAGHADDGQLRRRRVAAGRRDHRGEPRRGGHHLARSRSLRGVSALVTMRADDEPTRRRRRRDSTRSSARPASRLSTTTATSAAG